MDDHILEINRKIERSTQQFQRLYNSVLPNQKPLSPPNPNKQIRIKDKEQINLNDNPSIKTSKNKKHIESKHESLNQKFQKTKKLFYTPKKSKKIDSTKINPEQQLASSKKKYKNHQSNQQLFKEAKFDIQGHKYSQSQIKKQQSKKIVAISDLDHNYVLEYAKKTNRLTSSSSPQQIFDYFHQFVPYLRKPLIKKFKNCLFFGDPPKKSSNTKYEGFLYFYNKKIYYGSFENQHKNGLGVQINLDNDTTYKGIFQRGHKIGRFTVWKPDQMYEGYLNKGKYHGQGKLETPISVYKGKFYDGQRHGYGEQYFYKSKLKLVGMFKCNKFSNQNQQPKQKHSPHRYLSKQKVRLPKIANVFDYSYQDSSQSEQIQKKPSFIKGYNVRESSMINIQNESQQQDGPLPPPFKRFGLYNKT